LSDHGIFSTLFTAACYLPCSKLATIFKYGLITDLARHAKCFFVSHALSETRKRKESFYWQSH